MIPELVDTHCHLTHEPLSLDVGAALARARAAGVVQCLTIGTDVASSRAAVEVARAHASVRAAVGVHPTDTTALAPDALEAIEQLAQEPVVAAIGEVGLDYYWKEAPPADQERALRAFLGIARRRRLPLSIHCRDAYEALLAILHDEGDGAWRGILHCASGPAEYITEALRLGFHVAFAGNVTFSNAHALRALVPLVPDDRLLLETDAPFLAPQPVRGQKNEPAYVAHTAECLARLRGVPLEHVAAVTTANARRLLGFTNGGGP